MATNEESALVPFKASEDTGPPRVLMDSLPYVDNSSEEYESYALSLIEEEMKTTKPSRKRVLQPINLRSEVLKDAYDSVSKSREKMKIELGIDTQVAEPSQNTAEAWRAAVRSARAAYESERIRSVILEIEKSDASTLQWKKYGAVLEIVKKTIEQKLADQKGRVDKTNFERQKHQEEVAKSLHVLNHQWHENVRKRRDILAATRDLEHEVETLRQKVSSKNANK